MQSTPQQATQDYSKYLGREWVAGEYDCWSLVRDVYRDERGIDLPLVCVDASNARTVMYELKHSPIYGKFRFSVKPAHLAVAVMTLGQRATHVGVYVETHDGPRILHCDKGCGTVMEHPSKMAHRFAYYV